MRENVIRCFSVRTEAWRVPCHCVTGNCLTGDLDKGFKVLSSGFGGGRVWEGSLLSFMIGSS